MEIVPFGASHVEDFLRHAGSEGWLSDRREMSFLIDAYPEGCLMFLRDGRAAGFITAVRYERSAWIGNLLVLPEHRKKGIGRGLMETVLRMLDRDRCETVWLTASSQGAPLYASLGFRQIDRIQRWRGSARPVLPPGQPACPETVTAVDRRGWGDERPVLYRLLRESGYSVAGRDGFIACHAAEEFNHIGPWGALSREAAAALLETVVTPDDFGSDTFLDVPENNRAAGELLQAKGFTVSGATLLMYRGKAPAYRAGHVYALASLGSYG